MKAGTHIRYKKETDKELTGIVVETFLENGAHLLFSRYLWRN